MEYDAIEALREDISPALILVGEDIVSHLSGDSKELFDLWKSKRGDRPAPSRKDFTPHEMVNQLPLICLQEVSYDPFRLLVRVQGTHFVDAVGLDATGKYIDEIKKTEGLIARAKWVTSNCEPILCVRMELKWSPYDYKRFDSLVLPLIDENQNVEKILYYNRFY
jgi:hypothetical protein